MKILSRLDADLYLGEIGLRVGDWNQLSAISADSSKSIKWIKHQAPKNAKELFNFSNHIAAWVPTGKWKIFQIDNSGTLDVIQTLLIDRLLFGSESKFTITGHNTFLFEFGDDQEENERNEILIASTIAFFLLFESHGYLVSSDGSSNRRIGVQDGFAYLFCDEFAIGNAESLLKKIDSDRLTPPDWIVDILVKSQNGGLIG